MAERNGKEKTVVFNRRASHDYFLEDRFECGIQLTGTEIKSIRAGKVQFKDSYISIYFRCCYCCNFNRQVFRNYQTTCKLGS